MTRSLPLPAVTGAPRAILLATAVGLAILLCTAVGYRVLHPDSLQPEPLNPERAAPAPQQNQQVMDAVAALMQRLQADPHDARTLLALAEHFGHLEEWTPAEQFARRVTVAAPDDMRGHSLLSIALHGLGRHVESAASLEHALQRKDDPTLRYSLGVLYAYYLNDTAKGMEQLRKGLEHEGASDALRKDMRRELEDLEKKQ